jgi:sarcosine oxidase subunit beta
VLLLESGELGGGSSAKPLGGVRAQFSDATNIALGARSLAAFRRFETDLGVDIGLQQVGYLFALRDAADLPGFEASTALQRSMGVPSEIIDPAEAVRRCRYLSESAMVAAVWSPGDGYARPSEVVRGYAAAATARGVQIRTGEAVTTIELEPDGTALVRTGAGAYRTPTVICTAGAWSGQVAASVGVTLPITPLRRQIANTPPLTPPSTGLPFTIDYSSTAYFHPNLDGGLLVGWADPDQQPGFDRTVDDGWHRGLRDALRVFAPDLATAPLRGGWAGLYEMTPDCNAVIGETDAGFRFLYAAGFSGHGFLQAPAVGECVADLYLRRSPPVDVSAFTADRFNGPAVRTELGII